MKNSIKIFSLYFLVVFLAIADLSFGSTNIAFSDIFSAIFNYSTENTLLVREFRIPKMFTALFSGASLAISGLLMQSLFRNPLAGPYIFGINAGAGLGVALFVLGPATWFVFLSGFNSLSFMLIAAWLGAGAVMLLILSIARKIKSLTTILILGVLIGSAISAIVSILQYFSDADSLKIFVIWTMGSLTGVTSDQLSLFIPVFFMGLLISYLVVPQLNMVLTGEEYAGTIGVKLSRIRTLSFLATSILAGSVTAFCGPIGFVGVASPHIARVILRTANLHQLFFASLAVGSATLLAADIISQFPQNGTVLPINAITALMGIPVVVWVLIKRLNFFA